jgi:magnesium transporter
VIASVQEVFYHWLMLEEITGPYSDEIKKIIRETKTSIFEDYEDFKLLIIRKVKITEGNLGFLMDIYIIHDKKQVYTVKSTDGDVEKVKAGLKGLLKKVESLYLGNQKIIATYSTGVEKLEDYLFTRSTPTYFMDMWFDLKKILSKLENYYYRNSIVYREFFKNMEESFGELKDDFKDIEENISFQMSFIGTLMTRLDGVYSYFESIKADRLNKTLLSLTVISGVFLPLNLIVGFFGMNTPGLYFSDDPKGTLKVIFVLSAVLFVFLVGFKLVQIIDRFLLRYFLGRYNFYKHITSRLEDFKLRMRGK